MSVEQEVMCVLLKRLQDQGLISETIHDKARNAVLDTGNWPDYFCYSENIRREKANGSA